MPEVYIDSLTLENFGPFYGEHTLDFRSLEGKCGILVGGKNGAGKTHLLRAMYIAAVGESGVGDLKKVETGSDATRFTFEKALNRRAAAEGQDTIRLQIALTHQDAKVGSRQVNLIRKIRIRQNSAPVWDHHATRSETSGIIDDPQVIQKLRDAILPRHLARFFFFDAERSQGINLSQKDIVEGVSRILGYHTYAELENDLRQLISSKIPRVYSASGGPDPQAVLAELNGKVITLEGTLKARRHEHDILERDLKEKDAELYEIEDDLKTLGAVDPEEMQQAQERRGEIGATKAKLESKLSTAWEMSLPVSLLGSYRKTLFDDLSAEERRRDWESARSAVEPKIPQVKADVFGAPPTDFKLSPAIESFYIGRLENALVGLFHPPPEGMPDQVYIADRNDISAQIRQRLSVHSSDIRDLAVMCSNIDRMDAELRELDQKIRQMQQNKAAYARGIELHEKRAVLLAECERFSKRLKEIEADIKGMEVELTDVKRQETTQREVAEKAERGENLAALATRYREAAGEVRNRAAVKMRKQIAQEVGKLWIDIAERSLEFSGMEFDSHWQCYLLRRDRTKVTWDDTNTSAGQRQVRMLAFYEALRRLAKTVPPLVVDTPLARLDKEVRANVLDQLYLTGHQSIILSTNAEIDPDGPLFDRVRDRFARAYTLHPRGNPDSTDYEVQIKTNYFEHEL